MTLETPSLIGRPIPLSTAVRQVLDALRADLELRFGHAGFVVKEQVLEDMEGTALQASHQTALQDHRPRLTLTLLVPKLRSELSRRLADYAIFLRFETVPLDRWHRLIESPVPLYRQHPKRIANPSLTTELLPMDGPVAPLIEVEGARLVACVDGTHGWIEAELGEPEPPRPFLPLFGEARDVIEQARRYLGVPYGLGGATTTHLDCSSLTKRAFLQGIGLVLPRHSTDQIEFAGGSGSRRVDSHHEFPDLDSPRVDGHRNFEVEKLERLHLEPGDLLQLAAETEGLSHVVMVTEVAPTRVIHASVSAGKVIEEPLSRLAERARITRHASVRGLIAEYERLAAEGRAVIVLAEP